MLLVSDSPNSMSLHPNWKSLSTVDFAWKQFVREGSRSISNPSDKNEVNKILDGKAKPLTGAEAKHVYEEVVGLNPHLHRAESIGRPRPSARARAFKNVEFSGNPLTKLGFTSTISYKNEDMIDVGPVKETGLAKETVTRPRPNPVNSDLLLKRNKLNSFMKKAQENDVKDVSKLLSENIEINAKDQYGWTALMCAACSGATDVVKLLIKSGADTSIRDKSGMNCLSLAKRQRHLGVIQIIQESFDDKKRNSNASEQEKSLKPDLFDSTFYCDICRRNFCETTPEKHLTSTVHLFNSCPKSLGTVYGIPESNKGYQILLKGGWDREQGLGPEGSGHKFPCKTVFKRDRTGLGKPQGKPRVTHFGPKEEAAVRFVRKKMSRRQTHNINCSTDKKRDRELRQELS